MDPTTVTPPELLKFVPATDFPEQTALTEPIEVLLSIDIGTDGSVSRASVVTGAGSPFDEKAVEAAQRFRFRPARRGAEPIAVNIQFRYTFEPRLPPPPTDPTGAPAAPPTPAEPAFATEEIDDAAVIRGERIRATVAASTVSLDDAERVAGTQGDAVKVVQSLGGVARAPVGTSELVVWGAAPGDTRLYVDHLPVPRLFHVGGVRSILPATMVQALSLQPGGFAAEYGRAIGGLVRIDTKSPAEQVRNRHVRASARIDPIDVAGATSSRLGERASLSLSGRRSHLDRTLDLAAPDRIRNLVPIPRYWDYQGKLEVRLAANERLEVISLGALDRVDRSLPSITPNLAFTERNHDVFHRVGVRFRREHANHTVTRIDAWGGVDQSRLEQDFGYTTVFARQTAVRGGLRIAERREVHRRITTDLGLDLEFARNENDRRGAPSLPPREGDIYVFGQAPGDRIADDHWRTMVGQAGLYAAALVDLAQGRVTVEPGLRFEPTVVSGDRVVPVRETEPAVGYATLAAAASPRLRTSWRPLESVALHVAAGRYDQAAQAQDMSPVFGSPVLEPPRAWQALTSIETQPWPWLAISAAGFAAKQDRLTMRSPSATPPTAALLESHGEGRNVGAQAEIRFRPRENLFAWLTYSWIVASRRRDRHAAWRPFDRDQTHRAQAVASWRHRTGFEVGAKAVVASGFPRTAVIDAVYDARTGRYDPVFGAHNATRLPWFLDVSLRVGWRREWPSIALATWIDVQNATNYPNVEEIYYSADYRQRGYIRGLPVLPLAGLELRR
ncbi:MAG: TonB family protein [Myxococcales bacterium FL481]|nr:MAG: TonB family protein [Myxococcales bacterium FL481]